MAIEVYAGETVRITAKDLTHATDGPVTAGAVVTVTLYDPAGAQVGGSYTATASGDDWYVDIAAPLTAGQYEVKVVAVKSGATWKDRLKLTVKPF